MGSFEFGKQSPYGRRITAALRRRGLVPISDEEWIVHGPHGQDFPQPVFIGWARKRAPGDTAMTGSR